MRRILPTCVVPWALMALALSTGCVVLAPKSIGSLDTSEPGWRVQTGQAVWRPRRQGPELAGDLALARHPDGRFVLHFSKTPLPLVVVQNTAHRWRVEYVPQHRVVGGRHSARSQRIGWLLLPSLLDGRKPPAHWAFKRNAGGWELEDSKTGERLQGFLAP